MMDAVNTTTFRDELTVESAIARQLARQWFGNLVTVEWWDDLWLAKGIAANAQRLAVDKVTAKIQIK